VSSDIIECGEASNKKFEDASHFENLEHCAMAATSMLARQFKATAGVALLLLCLGTINIYAVAQINSPDTCDHLVGQVWTTTDGSNWQVTLFSELWDVSRGVVAGYFQDHVRAGVYTFSGGSLASCGSDVSGTIYFYCFDGDPYSFVDMSSSCSYNVYFYNSSLCGNVCGVSAPTAAPTDFGGAASSSVVIAVVIPMVLAGLFLVWLVYRLVLWRCSKGQLIVGVEPANEFEGHSRMDGVKYADVSLHDFPVASSFTAPIPQAVAVNQPANIAVAEDVIPL
jgi:hypothetical protein